MKSEQDDKSTLKTLVDDMIPPYFRDERNH